MKILCLHQGSELYGSDRSFISSLQAIKKIYPDAELTVFIPKKGPIVPELEKVADKLLIEDIGTLARNDFKNPLSTIGRIFRGTRKAIRQAQDYDLVYINTMVVISHILAARFTGKKTVVHVREIPNRYESLLFSTFLRFSNANIIFNSFNTRKAFYFQLDHKSAVIHNAIEGFNKNGTATPYPVKFLVIGRITEGKGQMLLAQTILQLPPGYRSKLKVRFVGDVPARIPLYAEKVRRFITDNGLSDTIEMHPFSKTPEEHYQWANVTVIPSIKPESFGRVAIEAMSIGQPVIASNLGGLTEIIADGVDGMLFTPGSHASLAEKIIELIDNQYIIEEMGRAAEKKFHEKFTIIAYENQLRHYFNIILHEKSR